jgi:peptidoglycan hydrolase CwlO-like protein
MERIMHSNKLIKPLDEKEGRRAFFRRLAKVPLMGAATAVGLTVASDTEAADSSVDKESFKKRVVRQLNELEQTTGSEGPIQIQISALRQRVNEVFLKLDECDQASGSMNDIQAVNRSLMEIKRILGIP